MLIYAILVTVAGAVMALWPQRRANHVEKRISEGDDRYFEEQRAYASYPRLRDPKYIRRSGLLVMIGGIALCILLVTGTGHFAAL